MTPIHSICILRLSAIGDVCHAIAVVQAIQAHYPKAQITWVVGRVEAALLQGLPGIDLVVFDKREGVAAYQKLRTQLPQTFDVLLHMQVALRANIAAACIKAKRKVGFAKHLAKELHGWVVNERAPCPAEPHVLDGFAAFAHAIGVPAITPSWHFPPPQAAQAWCSEQLAAYQISACQGLFVVSPAASNPERNWLPARYAQVMDYAASQGFAVVLSGGPSAAEQALAAAIKQHAQTAFIDWVGKTSLKQLLALLNRATLVLSPDSGPAHMATTQNTPVIGLYAHSNPARTGPYLSQPYVVEVYHQQLQKRTGKTAKQLPWGTRLKGDDLMAEITVANVIAQFDRVVSEHHGA